MKAMCVVAHPDDCVIFAYSFMHAHPQYEWTVCYLTYTKNDARGLEFFNFWNRRSIKTRFLGYQDDWHDIQNDRISFDEDSARKDLQLAIADQDLILTHNEQGDYGHLHHVFVNQATSDHPNRITFAGRHWDSLYCRSRRTRPINLKFTTYMRQQSATITANPPRRPAAKVPIRHQLRPIRHFSPRAITDPIRQKQLVDLGC
jgi:LmbE family N-acetylglucosaminyl deacetylase